MASLTGDYNIIDSNKGKTKHSSRTERDNAMMEKPSFSNVFSSFSYN